MTKTTAQLSGKRGRKKGYKHSEETKKKISESNKGNKRPHLIERNRTDLAREISRQVGKANKGWHPSEEQKEKHRQAHLGLKRTELTKQKISLAQKGDKHWNWQGGITPEHQRLRLSREYKLWREAVFKRDDYTCIWCSQRGGELNADHIKPFSLYPELRFALDNGRTLCVKCHKTTDTYLRGRIKHYETAQSNKLF